jgi:hypothetical protein
VGLKEDLLGAAPGLADPVTFNDGKNEVIRLGYSPDRFMSTSARNGMGVEGLRARLEAMVRELKQPQTEFPGNGPGKVILKPPPKETDGGGSLCCSTGRKMS